MAFTALSQTIQDLWLSQRQPVGGITTTLGSALVSDLAVDDFLPGVRATVTATGNTTAGNRALTLQRRGELTFTVSWPAASTVWVAR
jgi:hypothetical protein